MALPGQSFKRIVVLLLDCGATMQQPIRGDPRQYEHGDAFFPSPSFSASVTSSSTRFVSPASVSTVASSLHSAAPDLHSRRTRTAGDFSSRNDDHVASSVSAFEVMKQAALAYVQHLAASSARTDVGVVCFGSRRTSNSLAAPGDGDGPDGGYRNVEEACQPEPASWKAVRAVEKAEGSNATSDALDGIVVAVNMVEKMYGPKLTQNDVSFLLFSDCRARLTDSDDVRPVLEHLNHLGIRVHLILVDGSFGCCPPSLPLPLPPTDEPARRHLPALEPLAQLSTTLIPVESFLASPAARIFFPPLKRLSTKCRVNLTISPEFQIPVYVFVKVRKENLPTVRKRVFLGAQSAPPKNRVRDLFSSPDSSNASHSSSVSEESSDTLWRDLRVHRFYFRANDPDRKPVRLADAKSQAGLFFRYAGGEKSDGAGGRDVGGGRAEAGDSLQRLHAYRYGKQLVAVTMIEQEALKEKTTAGLVTLGVARLDDIQRWWNLGPTEYVTCALNNRPSLVALRSLVVALDRLQSVLLCTFVWRSGSPAKLVALLPYIGCCRRDTKRPETEQDEALDSKQADDLGATSSRSETYGLHLLYLPVAEDMLELRLPSLPSVTPAQLGAVEVFVERLALPHPPLVADRGPSGKKVASDYGAEEASRSPDTEVPLGGSLRLQATLQSPAGWQRNPALEVVAEHALIVDPPSPPCSSAAFSSFLPSSAVAYGSVGDYFDVRKIRNPALQRYYHLLVYRHYRPAPRPPPAVGDVDRGGFHRVEEAEGPELHQHVLPQLWSRLSVVEPLFKFRADPGDFQGGASSGSPPTERSANKDCDALLKVAYPLSTAPEAQLTVRRQKEMHKKLLLGEVVRKQQQLQLDNIKVSGGDSDVDEDAREPGQEPEQDDGAREEREREERIAALKRLHVGSVNPVRDFQRLLEVKETDLTEAAIQEMIDVIWRFLRSISDTQGAAEDSIENVRSQQLLRKALVCVQTLREGCSKELEGAKFNDFLRDLKVARAKEKQPQRAVSLLWGMLKENEVGLITRAEDPGVAVQVSERLGVYDEGEEDSDAEPLREERAPTSDAALADLLNLVE